jgi:hypothetical protein
MEISHIPLLTGNDNIRLDITTWQDTGIVYLNLHENEQTSVKAAHEKLSALGGIFIELKAGGERSVTFEKDGNKYTFDPNRIFSLTGIIETLKENNSYDPDVAGTLENMAGRIMETIMDLKPGIIIALHNTTGDYSIDNYHEGNLFERDRAGIAVNPEMDKGDFFFTTDREAFEIIKHAGYNVVLQDNEKVKDDGSLSVYCAIKGVRYINIEAMHGHLGQQMDMIGFAHRLFRKPLQETL